VTEVAQGFVVSNGPAFAPDGRTAYFADTMGRRLLAFALAQDGQPDGQRVLAELAEGSGYPDGLTVDSAGDLYVGHWDGARISRWSPDGRLLAEIPLPARNVTSLAFGSADLRTALVTTAALFPGQPEESGLPWNGDLLSFRAAVPGSVEPVLAPNWLD
jgi:sugar lactone lactonase YvrE